MFDLFRLESKESALKYLKNITQKRSCDSWHCDCSRNNPNSCEQMLRTFSGKVDHRPKRLYFCTFGLATILIWQTPINEQELTIEDGNRVSYLISFIVHCDKICNIFLSSWFDRGRNKHHLRCCFTIWGFQIKIHFKLNLMGFPYKKYFKA